MEVANSGIQCVRVNHVMISSHDDNVILNHVMKRDPNPLTRLVDRKLARQFQLSVIEFEDLA